MKTFRPDDADAFRALARSWAATVNVVTARRRPGVGDPETGELDGFTCTSFTPVSINPPIILVSVTNSASPLPIMREAACFAVNLLSHQQQSLAEAFSRSQGERPDLWQQVGWSPDAEGAPLLAGASGAFSARVRQLIEAGDHTLVLGDVTAIHHGEQPETLVYQHRGYGKVERHR